MQANYLILKFKKLPLFTFQKKTIRVLPDNINNIYLGGTKLNRHENTKYLGVALDELLSCSVHVNPLLRCMPYMTRLAKILILI